MMGNYEQLKSAIAAVIKTNGNNEITGALLQQVLIGMTSQIGANMTFKGVATPATQPATPDQNCFYMATERGVYSNFDGQELDGTKLAIFFNSSGAWRSWLMPIVDFTFDNTPTEDSTNPVTSDGIFKALMQHDDIIFFADVNGKKYEVEYVWNPRVQDWDELMSDTPLEINAGKIYIDHISFDMFTSPYVGAWIQLNALQTATYSGTIMTEQTAIAPTGTISKLANNVTKTFNLPAESGTLARREETLPNKTYAPAEFSGLGRKYLQKNIVSDKNVLTQAMVSEANTEFVVQYDYDLNDPNGENPITIPANCALKFEGGSIKNGKIVGNYTTLEGVINLDGVELAGTFKNESFTLYDIGCVPNDTSAASDNATRIISFANTLSTIKKDLVVPKGNWYFDSPIVLDGTFSLLCEGYLVYLCTSSNIATTALTIGTTSTYFGKSQRVKLTQSVSGYTFSASTIPDNVGVKFINAYYATINVDEVRNFVYSVIFVGTTKGSANNNITIRDIGWGNCYTALSLITDTGGWINENMIYGVTIHNSSGNVYSDQMVGIYLSGSSAHDANNNVFYKPDVEQSAVGIKLNYATRNNFYDVRTEGVTTIIEDGTGCRSNIVYTYEADYGTFRFPSVYLRKDDIANVLQRQVFKAKTSYVLWKNQNDYDFASGIHLDVASYGYNDIGSSVRLYGISSLFLGHIVNTTNVKRFMIKAQASTRFYIRPFDVNGNIVTSNAINYTSLFTLDADSRGYTAQTDVVAFAFGFTSEVKSAFIGARASAGEIELCAYCRNGSLLPDIISDSHGIINVTRAYSTVGAITGDRVYNPSANCFHYWNGSKWVNIDGYLASRTMGTTAQRPTLTIDKNSTSNGFGYNDTTIAKLITFTAGKHTKGSQTNAGKLGNKYISNPFANGEAFYGRISQGEQNNTIKFIFAKTNSSTADGIEYDMTNLGNYSGSYYAFETDILTAPDPTVYPYICISIGGTGDTYYKFLTLYAFSPRWLEADGAVAGVKRSGTTANRPASTDIYVGFEYFDTDLGLKVVWNGTSWIVLPKYEVVSALPASPDSNTLYLIAES